MTLVTRMMCSLSRVVSAGDKKSYLAKWCWSWCAPFLAVRSVQVDEHLRCTGAGPHRGMLHCRSVLHRCVMSRNQSRTMGSTWTVRRFAVLLLGSSSTSAAAGVGGAAGAAGVLTRGRRMSRSQPPHACPVPHCLLRVQPSPRIKQVLS